MCCLTRFNQNRARSAAQTHCSRSGSENNACCALIMKLVIKESAGPAASVLLKRVACHASVRVVRGWSKTLGAD